MATAPNAIKVELDVELSEHTRALLDKRRPQRLLADAFDVPLRLLTGATPRSVGEKLEDWLTLESAALIAVASIAGDGAKVVVDEKLSRLEDLLEHVRLQDRRVVELENDVAQLDDAARTQAADATEARAQVRLLSGVLGEIIQIAHQHTLSADMMAALGRLELAGSAERGAALERIHDMARTVVDGTIATGMARAVVEDEGE